MNAAENIDVDITILATMQVALRSITDEMNQVGAFVWTITTPGSCGERTGIDQIQRPC